MISLTRNVILLSSVAVAVLGSQPVKANLSALKYLALAIISISFWMGCVTVLVCTVHAEEGQRRSRRSTIHRTIL
jgi:putative copper export protein